MVTETLTTFPAAAQHLPPVDPIAAVILAHKHVNAAYLGARDRLWHLIEAVDPDLDVSDLDEVRAKLAAHYGAEAPARIGELLIARDVSAALGAAEDAAWARFADVPLNTADQVAAYVAYVAYVKAHAQTQDGPEALLLWRAMDRLAALLGERLAA